MDLPVPDHTHLSRRVRALTVQIERCERSGPIHVVADSMGLKVFGEGEWKVRQHGAGNRWTWLKVHLAVDADIRDVIEALRAIGFQANRRLLEIGNHQPGLCLGRGGV